MGDIEKIRTDSSMGEIVNFNQKKIKFKGKAVKVKKDGTPKMTQSNSKSGDIHEKEPIRNKDDIEKMKNYFREKIKAAKTNERKREAARNLLGFIIGLNTGLRASDILKLTWGDIFDEEGQFREFIRTKMKKTKRLIEPSLNVSCRNAINEYIETCHPNLESENYIFRSREGGHIEVRTFSKIIKNSAIECGIKGDIASHSLRKGFSYHFLMANQNDVMALTWLQSLLGQTSSKATLHYAGLERERNKEFYNSNNL